MSNRYHGHRNRCVVNKTRWIFLQLLFLLIITTQALLLLPQTKQWNSRWPSFLALRGHVHRSSSPCIDTDTYIESTTQKRPRRQRKVPTIAIIGRPNVGKSALVNRISGTHQRGGAIVADESGITRDRTYRPAEFLGERLQLVDTGGFLFDSDDSMPFQEEIRVQALHAIQESTAVIMVVDGQSGGPLPSDEDLAFMLRTKVQETIPITVAVNKCESNSLLAAEFWKLGLGEPMLVSALHGIGTAELLERVFKTIREREGICDGCDYIDFGLRARKWKIMKELLMHPKRYGENTKRKENETENKSQSSLWDKNLYLSYGLGMNRRTKLKKFKEMQSILLDKEQEQHITNEDFHVAIVGKPNVGKSSLLNILVGENRVIVGEEAGTTRDSIDVYIKRESPVHEQDRRKGGGSKTKTNDGEREETHQPLTPTIYRFVDTAGIRRKKKVEYGPEFFMVNRALRAIQMSDAVLLVLDATTHLAEQDLILAQRISDDGRACILICNKWDAVQPKDNHTYDASVTYIRNELSIVQWAPILHISVATGRRCHQIYDLVDTVVTNHRRCISTALLNQVLRDAILWQPPYGGNKSGSHKVRIYYCVQSGVSPPTIMVFCNNPRHVSDGYRRYLDRKFRENVDEWFVGTPIRWIFRGRRARDVMNSSRTHIKSGEKSSSDGMPFPNAV